MLKQIIYEALKPDREIMEMCVKCGSTSEVTRVGNFQQESEPYCNICFMDEFHGTQFNHELNDRYDD